MFLFFAGCLVGVDKHLFQRVSFITSMTLPLNYIFVLLLANVHVIPKQKQLSIACVAGGIVWVRD